MDLQHMWSWIQVQLRGCRALRKDSHKSLNDHLEALAIPWLCTIPQVCRAGSDSCALRECPWQLQECSWRYASGCCPGSPSQASMASLFTQPVEEIISPAWSVYLSVLSHTSWPKSKLLDTSAGCGSSSPSCRLLPPAHLIPTFQLIPPLSPWLRGHHSP